MPVVSSVFADAEIVAPAWAAIRRVRDGHHRFRSCPTSAERALAMLDGTPVPPECWSCYDLLVDVLVHLGGKAAGGLARARNRAAYARVVADHVAVEHLRADNVRLGGVAKPERRDGVVGRVRAALASSGELDPGWADELLTLVLASAATRAPVPSTVWPYPRFAEARRRHTGVPAGDAVVAAEVRHVLATIERVAGRAWLDAYVQAPLLARAAAFAAVPWDEVER